MAIASACPHPVAGARYSTAIRCSMPARIPAMPASLLHNRFPGWATINPPTLPCRRWAHLSFVAKDERGGCRDLSYQNIGDIAAVTRVTIVTVDVRQETTERINQWPRRRNSRF